MKATIQTYFHSSNLPPDNGNNLFHSNELFCVCEQTNGYQPILLVAWCEGIAVGRLLGIIRPGSRWLPGKLTRRCEVYGSGTYTNKADQKELFALLLERLSNIAIRQVLFIEFRNLENPMFAYRYFRQNSYFPANWIRIHNSLHGKHPELRLSSSRRRQIKSALANGATFHPARNMEETEAFLTLLRRHYASKLRKHFPGIDFFHRLLDEHNARQLGQVLIVAYKGHVIGGSVVVFSEGNAYLWFSAGLQKSYPRQYPGVLAVWAAMLYAYDQKYHHIEFMDVGLAYQHYGYRDFILRFGGIQYSTRRWFRVRWQWLNRFFTYLHI